MVHAKNIDGLAGMDLPVLRMDATHTGAGSPDDSDDLMKAPAVLKLAIGARVMITENIWTAAGLTNGAVGIVRAFGFAEGASPQRDLPLVIMVEFSKDKYIGPTRWTTNCAAQNPIVPIVPWMSEYRKHGRAAGRRQFPLNLAFCITVHKSLGLTLDKVKIDLGNREFAAGLTFVAVSRVKRFADLVFSVGFNSSRLDQVGRGNCDDLRKEEQTRYPSSTQ